MLNMSRVLNYIKTNLGFPFQTLELEDDTVTDYIKEYTLRTWSQYFPEKKKMSLDLQDATLLAESRQNEFYLEEPSGLEMLNVIDILFPASRWYAMGHPPIGTFTFGDIEYFSLNALKAADAMQFSDWDYTFEFIHPNIVRISPDPTHNAYCVVEYECMQTSDLSGISNDLQMYFCRLALADIKIVIGSSRKKYGTIRTPFGEINVDAELATEGKEERTTLLEQLSSGSHYNIVFDIG